jgi:hypothetical protein
MKKSLVILGVAIFCAAALPSCKKDYTCTCEVESKKYIYDYTDRLKSEAEDACTQQDAAAKRADASGACKLTKD